MQNRYSAWTALESVGIEVDPRNQTLKRLPSTRLKEVDPILWTAGQRC